MGRTGELTKTGSQAGGGGLRIPGSSFKVGEESLEGEKEEIDLPGPSEHRDAL